MKSIAFDHPFRADANVLTEEPLQRSFLEIETTHDIIHPGDFRMRLKDQMDRGIGKRLLHVWSLVFEVPTDDPVVLHEEIQVPGWRKKRQVKLLLALR